MLIKNPSLEAQGYDVKDLESTTNDSYIQKASGCQEIAYRSHSTIYTPYGRYNNGGSILLNVGLECFAEHNNFTITPDSIWSLIGDTVAKTVSLYPDKYSHLLMHGKWDGSKKEIEVRNDSQTLNGEWKTSIELFREKLIELVPEKTVETLTPQFSTSGEMENLSKLLTLMDAGSSYYTYVVSTRCGVPQIKLEGTPSDWMKIYNLLDWVAVNIEDLKLYATYLQGHVMKIVQTITTKEIDYRFWGDCIKYNNNQGSGSGPTLNGWLNTFTGITTTKGNNKLKDYSNPSLFYTVPHDSVATCSPVVNFIWDYFGNRIPMKFVGGIIGSDNIDGFNTPVFGYAVTKVDQEA